MKRLIFFAIILIALASCSPAERVTDDLYADRVFPTQVGSPDAKVTAGYFHELYVDNTTLYMGGVPLIVTGNLTAIQGPQGPPGENGTAGSQGLQGISGPNEVVASTTTNLTGIFRGDGANVTITSNSSILDAIQEAFTTALKTSYDWLVTNITEEWKSKIDNFITSTINGHALSANVTINADDVGLGSVPNLDTTYAVNNQHIHSNSTVLNAIQESLTTVLKTSYDWLVDNITSVWKTAVDNHVASTSNPHSVTKAQVGLTNVTDDAQIPKSLVHAKGDIISATDDNTPARLGSSGVNNNVLTVDTTTATGLKWATPAGGNDPRIFMHAVAAGEQHDITASTALTKVTVLDQTLAAGTYTVQYYVIYRSNQLTNGIRLSINWTGTHGAFVWNWRGVDVSATASTAAADQDEVLTTGAVEWAFANRDHRSTTSGYTGSVDTINSDMLAIIEGVFVATGTGNLELWHGSELATAAYTTSVMPGTSVIVAKTE